MQHGDMEIALELISGLRIGKGHLVTVWLWESGVLTRFQAHGPRISAFCPNNDVTREGFFDINT